MLLSRNSSQSDVASHSVHLQTNRWQRILPLVVCAFSLGMVSTRHASAAPPSEETLDKRRVAISQYNESQRKDLVRKYDAYRQLSDADRAQIRNLHQKIEADANLKEVMKQYCEWLKNLDVTQRDQLRQAKTPEQKRDLVVRFRAEQSRQKMELEREVESPGPERERRQFAPLSSEQLKGVMSKLEEEMVQKEFITKDRQKQLASLPGTQRYKLLLNSIGEYRHPKEGPTRRFTLPDPVLTAVADGIQNPDLQKKVRGLIGNSEPGQFSQAPLYLLLRVSVLAEAKREFASPDADQLKESIFQSLKPEMQARFSQLPHFRQEFVLMGLHAEELMEACSAAGDLPPRQPPGEEGSHGRRNGNPGDRPREGGPRNGNRPRSPLDYLNGPPTDGRRQPRERPPVPNQ